MLSEFQMKNRGGKVSIFTVVIILVAVIAVVHTLIQIHFFSTEGISGFFFANSTNINSGTNENPAYQKFSVVFLIGEWLILGVLVAGNKIIKRKNSASEIKKIIAEKKTASSSAKTDLDVLYEILKHRKKLGISDIASAFNVTKDVAEEWCKMLEDSSLAEIEYSNIGEPVIKVK